MNDYVDILKLFDKVTLGGLFVTFLLLFLRLVPLVAITPFLGGKFLTREIKMLFAFVLTLFFLPNVIHVASESTISGINIAIYAIKEVAVGIILAFLASIPFLHSTIIRFLSRPH